MTIPPATAASWEQQPGQYQTAQLTGGGQVERRGDDYYYNGQRGSREPRDGWRQYNGFWFPLAAFSLSVNQSSAHVEWCRAKYRSYQISGNTYQPQKGPRRVCVSPYSR